jgi:hypothetical protein
MQRKGVTVSFLVVAATLFAPISLPAPIVPDSYYPGNFQATYKSVLEGARKLWRKDAVITFAELQGAFGIPQAWWRFDLYSPSINFAATYTVGGPLNGQSTFSYIQPYQRKGIGDPLPPEINVNLPAAIASLRKAGFNGALGLIRLHMAGATGTQPLPAWSIRVGGKSPTYPPVFINAQDGKFIPVSRAMDPAPGSDAELRAIYGRAMQRIQSGGRNASLDALECLAMLQLGYLGCP